MVIFKGFIVSNQFTTERGFGDQQVLAPLILLHHVNRELQFLEIL